VRARSEPGRERNDDRFLSTADGVALFGEDRARSTSVHAAPAWKLVTALDGELELRVPGAAATAAGVLVPPDLPHALAATGAYRCLLVEPWVDPLGAVPGPVLLDRRLTGRLAAELAAVPDLPALAGHVAGVLRSGLHLPAPPPVSARVREAAASVGTATSLGELADQVGLSGSRLRELVRAELGVRLTRLRLWHRLRSSATAPGGGLAQRAADAGFSDQAHLSRTARRFVGRTAAALVGPADRG
jgi:AraC-like DNA-binding protein